MRKKIRSKSNEPHVTGTKSFARLVHEEKEKNGGFRISRGTTYRISRTRKDGSVVNGQAAEVIDKLKNVTDESSGTFVGIDWRNDDLAKVKGPEKGDWIRCLGKLIRVKDKGSSSSQDPQVPLLKARVNELQEEVNEMKETKEKQDAEIKEMEEKQDAMICFMAILKDQLPNAANLSNIFNSFSIEVSNDSCSAYIHGPNQNATSSHGSKN